MKLILSISMALNVILLAACLFYLSSSSKKTEDVYFLIKEVIHRSKINEVQKNIIINQRKIIDGYKELIEELLNYETNRNSFVGIEAK